MNRQTSGGTSILIRNNILHSQINITTNLQAVAVRATQHKTINICSIYIPLHDSINGNDFQSLIEQTSKPFIRLGDFSSHSTAWGKKVTNLKGKPVEKFINENDLCLLNEGAYTYIKPRSGNRPALDLTVCDPTVYMDFSWDVKDDNYRSDHFPILLKNTESRSENISR